MILKNDIVKILGKDSDLEANEIKERLMERIQACLFDFMRELNKIGY